MKQASAGGVATSRRPRQPEMQIDQPDADRLVITLPWQAPLLSLAGYLLAVPLVMALALFRRPYLMQARSSPMAAWMLAAGWTLAVLYWLLSSLHAGRTLTFDRNIGILSIVTRWPWGGSERVVLLDELTGVKLRRIAAAWEVLLLRAKGLAIGARRFRRFDDAARLVRAIERFLHPVPPKVQRRTVRGKPGRSGVGAIR